MFGGFGGFPGMSGGPGGGGEEGESSDSSKYYEILDIPKDASERDIKKAYRKKAMSVHPDRHPGEEEKYQQLFQEVNQAHEVLSDPDKRKLYDRYGEAGLKGAASQSDMGDIFKMFMGGHGGMGGMGGGGRRRPRQAPPIKLPLDVTLEDLYIGSTKTVHYKRFLKCHKCSGKGGSHVTECSTCDGRGQQTVVQMMGPMRIMQQRQCPACDGEGSIIRPGDRCGNCEGKGVREVEVDFDVVIPQGAKHADNIVNKGEGHELPDVMKGDMVCIVRVEKHKIFQRVGADLIMNYTLSLKEALCGFTVKIPHFNGAILVVKSQPDEVIQHDTTKVVFGKGMPQRGALSVYGNLYIKFQVKLPEMDDGLTPEILTVLREVLPEDEDTKEELDTKEHIAGKRRRREEREAKLAESDATGEEEDEDESSEEPIEIHEDCEVVDGEPTVTPASAKSAYDEDDEEEGGGCRQM